MMDAMNDMTRTGLHTDTTTAKITARGVQVHYGQNHALKDVDVDSLDRAVTAFIGPSGCGKSTFLRCLNRMNDTVASARVTGKILLEGEDIYDPRVDPVQLRAKVGMVFQKPNPFPKSIYDNVAYGPKIHGLTRNKADLDQIVQASSRHAAPRNPSRSGPDGRAFASLKISITRSASDIWRSPLKD